jgi:hypothetical protein
MPQFDPAARELVRGRIQNRPTIGLLDIGLLARVHDGRGRDLANSKPGISRVCAARREADRRGRAVARRARVGRTRAVAMASPMARRRASPAGRGSCVQIGPARVLSRAPPGGNTAGSLRRRARSEPDAPARMARRQVEERAGRSWLYGALMRSACDRVEFEVAEPAQMPPAVRSWLLRVPRRF